ncbi:hypothetical protein [Pareuzebyella sediminis]|uniref:hypothetical protein n=1 Tax=Pareuzebyella sediminis TaxID=2607998 RepID=UPI0011EDD6F7|nr:hypothetical protein [Pareuzebyella sediminis]
MLALHSCRDLHMKSAWGKDKFEKEIFFQTQDSQVNSNTAHHTVYFEATGTEPFWGLSISNTKILFKTPSHAILTPSPQPVRSAESNVKSYLVETELAELIIVIVKTECTNAMSGKVLPYKVNISCRKMVNASFVRIQGCGEYKRDKRLHDSWMLEKMGKEK